jgi:hypothetical protein
MTNPTNGQRSGVAAIALLTGFGNAIDALSKLL